MLFQIKSYLKFIWKSKNEHGVHSPFVYDLLTKCFYDKKEYLEYKILKNYRKSLLEDKNFIEVTDFGAGSKVFKSNLRQISKIAKTAGITSKRAELLYRIVKYLQPENILEIGTSLGLATIALSLGNKNGKIATLEGCINTLNQCKSNLKLHNINNVECINAKFEDYFKTINIKSSTLDLIYFDGNHSQEATLEYFEQLLPTITNNSVWIFDDIHWSEAMEKAWEIIKKNDKVSVTIDTFEWGIVFFRSEQIKENFIIRV